MKSIRFWVPALISLLLVLVISMVSIFSYQSFKSSLDERVLLQLLSIKKLKRVQIEQYIDQQWLLFDSVTSKKGQGISEDQFFELLSPTFQNACLRKVLSNQVLPSGIYDITSCNQEGLTSILFIKSINKDSLFFQQLDFTPIQEILLERTGMGQSGESYLVGADYSLRSTSRFFPEKIPSSITVKTTGALAALEGENGYDIIEDYRGIDVYSAYHQLKISFLHWAILSEIDLDEVAVPLKAMRDRLILIGIITLIIAITASLLLSNLLLQPLLAFRVRLLGMARGNFDEAITTTSQLQEIADIFKALAKLKQSINQAIVFCAEISSMHLDAKYHLAGEYDELGKSLLKMQEKLVAYDRLEKENKIRSKSALIEGQEKERKRLSQELHDGLGPLFTTIKFKLENLKIEEKELSDIKEMVDNTIQEIRNMSYNLMPPTLSDFGVSVALKRYVSLSNQSSGFTIKFQDELLPNKSKLNDQINIGLFRICQELINNSIKHSRGKNIIFTITEFKDRVSLFYQDDGVGIKNLGANEGFGLRNIMERVEVLNGEIVFTSQEGMQVEIDIPIGR
ncbi:MAG: sensor histidine kinase [Cyclobacteriaceae bacterium]